MNNPFPWKTFYRLNLIGAAWLAITAVRWGIGFGFFVWALTALAANAVIIVPWACGVGIGRPATPSARKAAAFIGPMLGVAIFLAWQFYRGTLNLTALLAAIFVLVVTFTALALRLWLAPPSRKKNDATHPDLPEVM